MASTVVQNRHLLAYAARLNRADAVAALVHFGEGVNVQHRDDRTSLHIAAMRGYVDVIRALVVGKPRFDLEDVDGKTVLWLAVDNGHMDAAAALLDAGATPHARLSDRISPIHTACEHGHVDIVKLLLAHTGEKSSFSDLRIDPIGLLDTALTQSEAMVEAVVASFQPRKAGRALHDVARRGRLDAVKVLLAVYAPVDWTNKDHVNTPLYMAAQAGYVDVVKALLAAGARADGGDEDARTRAAERSERKLKSLLVSK